MGMTRLPLRPRRESPPVPIRFSHWLWLVWADPCPPRIKGPQGRPPSMGKLAIGMAVAEVIPLARRA
jgi:hypothetical protein